MAGLNVDLPDDLHRDAKVTVAELDADRPAGEPHVTLKAFVIEAIAAAVERHRAERAKR